MSSSSSRRTAVLYRMVMPEHVCPWGLKARWLLRRKGFEVRDHWLRNRQETQAFQEQHHVKTTPQVFIDGQRIGGYDDLRRYFHLPIRDPEQTSYQPVMAVFAIALLMASATAIGIGQKLFSVYTLNLFAAFTMSMLAMLKLQDLESFSTMFLNYDLLARRWVPYAYLYPLGELAAGVLMVSRQVPVVAGALALFLGSVGSVSVIKAVYIDRRELRCACVGGGSKVPLGFVSLTENLVMLAMGAWSVVRG